MWLRWIGDRSWSQHSEIYTFVGCHLLHKWLTYWERLSSLDTLKVLSSFLFIYFLLFRSVGLFASLTWYAYILSSVLIQWCNYYVLCAYPVATSYSNFGLDAFVGMDRLIERLYLIYPLAKHSIVRYVSL